jgi:FtsZ-binding cell division protein ZapB
MVRTIAIRLTVLATLVLVMLSLLGCLRQYEPSSAEVRQRIERSAEAEKQILQLQNDLNAAKSEAKKADQVKNDLEAKAKMLERVNADLRDQVNTLEQKSRTPVATAEEKAEKAVQLKKEFEEKTAKLQKELGEKTAQLQQAFEKTARLQRELDAAKNETRKVEQAKKDAEAKITALEQENTQLKSGRNRPSGPLENLSGTWEITYQGQAFATNLEPMGSNNYRLGPKGLGFSGIYLFDGATLSMVAENAAYPKLAWSLRKPGLFEVVAGPYAGATMKRKTAGSRP